MISGEQRQLLLRTGFESGLLLFPLSGFSHSHSYFKVLFWFCGLPSASSISLKRICRSSWQVHSIPGVYLRIFCPSMRIRIRIQIGRFLFPLLYSFHLFFILLNRKFLCLWQTEIIRGSRISANYNGAGHIVSQETVSYRFKEISEQVSQHFLSENLHDRKEVVCSFEMGRWHPGAFVSQCTYNWRGVDYGSYKDLKRIYGNTKEQRTDREKI